MKKFIIAVIILILCCPITTYAENASSLLNLYGLDNLVSVEIEEKLLQDITKEYHDIHSEINKKQMVEDAINIYSSNYDCILDTYDIEIETLNQELTDLKKTIYDNRNQSVETLLDLDSRYQSIEHKLNILIEERNEQKCQKELVSYESIDLTKMEKEQNKIKRRLNYQQKIYNDATTYPELGNTTNLNYPLGKPSHITSNFGKRIDPIGKVEVQFHRGLDLSASLNTNVTALFNGTVERTAYNNGLGNYVIINHGKGIQTLYGHLTNYTVYEGQQVKQYDIIAKSGNTGSRSTGPHLHLGIYINGIPVDPIKVFKN